MRVLERLERQLQHDALLRVHVLGLERAETEHFVVEGRDVAQIPAGGAFVLELGAHEGVGQVLRPAPLGQGSGGHLAVDKQLPKLADAVRAGEAARGADDGDVAGAR